MKETKGKLRVGIVGATGMVGQRLVSLLDAHPWFDLRLLAASRNSAGKPYREAVKGRWALGTPMPETAGRLKVLDAAELETIADAVDFVFCAVSLPKKETRALEEALARLETPVISCNSACRMLPDVPMLIPEINPGHAGVIEAQRKRLGTRRGFITVKPNCSIQTYVPALTPLLPYRPSAVVACTYQAVSGAGKTMADWPEIERNVIPFIAGEEEKSEREPLKIWGGFREGDTGIRDAEQPLISAQCVRVPVDDGHLAAVSVRFEDKPKREDILRLWREWEPAPQRMKLPSAPRPFLVYREEDDRPQPALDRDAGGGMAVVLGRLREDPVLDWRFVSLSHNTLRGAAGGSVLSAELLQAQGYLERK